MEIVEFLLPPLITCFLIIGITVYFGIHVIKREIIFIDIALAQIAALGVAVAYAIKGTFADQGNFVNNFIGSDLFTYVLSILFCTIAALIFTLLKNKIIKIPLEAIIGITYAVATCGTVIIYDKGAGGDIHVHEMLTGTILWATWEQIPRLLFVVVLVGGFHVIFRKKFISLSSDYLGNLDGIKGSKIWDFLFYFSFGVVIVEAVRIGGIITIFAFLIIPSSISALLASSWLQRILIGLGIGYIAAAIGLYISWMKDVPCSPVFIIFLGISLLGAVIFRSLKTIVRAKM